MQLKRVYDTLGWNHFNDVSLHCLPGRKLDRFPTGQGYVQGILRFSLRLQEERLQQPVRRREGVCPLTLRSFVYRIQLSTLNAK